MTIAEAAVKLDMNPTTVRRWIKTEKLRAEKQVVAGVETWIIDAADLDAFIVGRSSGGRSEEPVQPTNAAAAVLVERVAGLEAMLELLKSQVDHKDQEIRALLSTNARLADQNSDLQQRALPAPAAAKASFWERIRGR
jgi:excisionase family DNA binding protein